MSCNKSSRDKVVFGIYLYSKSKRVYNNAPVMVGYFDLDFVESLKRQDITIMMNERGETSGEDLTVYKIVADHRYCMNNVIFICYAAIPESFTLTGNLKPKFNASYTLSKYIDAIASRIMNLEDEWKAYTSKIPDAEFSKIVKMDGELSEIVHKLSMNNKYYEIATSCADQFVPYKTFIENFFNECDFYDIIPLLERRLELFKSCAQKYNRTFGIQFP